MTANPQDFIPMLACGVLAHVSESGEAAILGTACFFRSRTVALTASHAVPADLQGEFLVATNRDTTSRVDRIARHPQADLAVLFLQDRDEDHIRKSHVFEPSAPVRNDAEDFLAFGFPTEGRAEGPYQPTGRLFKGNYQRYFQFRSPEGYEYFAGEMSIPAPGGLSGGPVMRAGAPRSLTGVVTANLDSYALLDRVDEGRLDGKEFSLRSQRVISYGIAVLISGVSSWLDNELGATS